MNREEFANACLEAGFLESAVELRPKVNEKLKVIQSYIDLKNREQVIAVLLGFADVNKKEFQKFLDVL